MKDIAKYIDHTLLRADATKKDIDELCSQARKWGFWSVCINPYYVKTAFEFLKGSEVKVCTVVGFPLGATLGNIKAFEAQKCVQDGANEIDMVANISAIKNGDMAVIEDEIKVVRNTIGKDIFLKVIIETCLLMPKELVTVSKIVKNAGADCVKTSTGFSKYGARVEDVKLIREAVGDGFDIKASGGIRDLETVLSMLDAGATRIGASASVKIMTENLQS